MNLQWVGHVYTLSGVLCLCTINCIQYTVPAMFGHSAYFSACYPRSHKVNKWGLPDEMLYRPVCPSSCSINSSWLVARSTSPFQHKNRLHRGQGLGWRFSSTRLMMANDTVNAQPHCLFVQQRPEMGRDRRRSFKLLH